MIKVPEKYLNNNVRAMLSGRKNTFLKPNFHFNKLVSFFNRNYRVEVKIFIEKSKD